MSSLVSYGKLRPAFIGVLGVIFTRLFRLAESGDARVKLRAVEDLIALSDSGVWGDEAVDPENDLRVFRVSDFAGDFQLNMTSAPPRSVPASKRAKYELASGDLLVVKSSGSAKQVVSGRVAVFEGNGLHSYAASNFLLRLRPQKDVDPHYLAYALGSPLVREKIADSVKTMTYPNLPFKLYRTMRVPVVPIENQRQIALFLTSAFKKETLTSLPAYLSDQLRVVVKLEELSAKIEEARALQGDIDKEGDALCRSILLHPSNGVSELTPMSALVRLREPDVIVQPEETYQFAGVYCFGGGVFRGPLRRGTEFSYTRLTRLHAQDFVYPKLMAWEGALGVVPAFCDGLVVSPEYPVFEVDETRVLPETLDVYFRNPAIWPSLAEISTGTNVRRRRLHPNRFLGFRIPLPSMEAQMRLREARKRVEDVKSIRAGTATTFDALMPSILSKAFSGEL